MKIVKFKDDTYALRKGFRWFGGYMYIDLQSHNKFMWSIDSEWFGDCVGSLEEVLCVADRLGLMKYVNKKLKVDYGDVIVDLSSFKFVRVTV